MNHIYKTIILCAIILFSCSEPIFSQYIGYGYDAAGNRIKRVVVMSTYSNDSRKAPKKSFVSEMLSDKTIRIYPNPTKGMLKIEVSGWSELDAGSITVFNTNGARLVSTPLSDPATTVDITGCAPGIYLMLVRINDKESTWKIIKE